MAIFGGFREYFDAAIPDRIAAGYHPAHFRFLEWSDHIRGVHSDRGGWTIPPGRGYAHISQTAKPCPVCHAIVGMPCIRFTPGYPGPAGGNGAWRARGYAVKLGEMINRDYQRQGQRRRRMIRGRAGICTDCRDFVEPGKRRCRQHLDAAKDRAAQRRNAGAATCMDCTSAPESGRRRCAKHLDAAKDRARQRRNAPTPSEGTDDAPAA